MAVEPGGSAASGEPDAVGTPDDRVYGQNPDHVRPDWEEYFLKIMDTVAERTADR